MAVFSLLIFDEIFQVTVLMGVNGEGLALIHVVIVVPDVFEGQIVLFIQRDHGYECHSCSIINAALSPTECPNWWQLWPADQSVVSLHNFIGICSEHNGDIDTPSSCNGRNIDLAIFIVVFDQPILGCGQIGINSKPGRI